MHTNILFVCVCEKPKITKKSVNLFYIVSINTCRLCKAIVLKSSAPNFAAPISVTVRCKVWVCGRFESVRGHGCLSLVSAVCCRVEVCASGRSLVQRSPTEYGVSERDREVSILKGPKPTGGLLRH
jgi:hypothetical protein